LLLVCHETGSERNGMIEMLGLEEMSGFGGVSVQMLGLRQGLGAQRNTAISNELHMSTVLCNTGSMILHSRTSTYVSKHQDLDVSRTERLVDRSSSRRPIRS